MTETPRTQTPGGVDTTVAHSARVWNYWLGGKDNYPVDRAVGDEVKRIFPAIVELARADRAYLMRAVTYLAREEGARQFLDIGTGLPTHGNTHEVAQAITADARVVYVDNDPMVLAHARALLNGGPSTVAYIDADLREPAKVLAAAERTLDFSAPIAVTFHGTLGHIRSASEARDLVAAYLGHLAPGSWLSVCDGTTSEGLDASMEEWNSNSALPYYPRPVAEFAAFFDGLELVEPGVVSAPLWRPDPAEVGESDHVDQYAGLARKP